MFAALVLAAIACNCAARIPLPQSARGLDARAVVQRATAKRDTVRGFQAEVRLQYFSNGERYKGTANVFARRPDHLRYDVQGPHGGVLLAFATDGNRLAALDMTSNRMTEGRATPEHFDTLLPLAPLGFTGEQWVSLMFGEIAVPQDATSEYDDRAGLFQLRWRRGDYDLCVGVDPQTFEARRAQGSIAGRERWRVAMGPRDARGMLTTLRVQALGGTDIELRWRDVDVDVDADTSPDGEGADNGMFVLPHPRGVTVHSLDD